jgi:hypothetical protein
LAQGTDQLSRLFPSCMRYKHWDSEPDFDTDVCPRFTFSSSDGLIRRAMSVSAYLKVWIAHVTLQQRLFLWRAETSGSMDSCLFNTRRVTGSSSWVWLRSMFQKKTITLRGHSKAINSEVIFFRCI